MVADGGVASLPTDRAPQNAALIAQWLTEGHYLDWRCEAEKHAAREPSPHGINRICQNTIASDAIPGTGNFPVGATMVKEQYGSSGDTVLAIEVSVRENETDGANGWRFWRGQGEGFARVTQNVVNDDFCAGCHESAERDFVWTPLTGE